MTELKANPGCCEEAAPISSQFYIPCNQPATRMVSFIERGEGPYRMCAGCAWHNTKNRGATDIGPFDPKALPIRPSA